MKDKITAVPKYRVIGIGKTLDCERSIAVAVNNRGQVVIQAMGKFATSYLWTNGKIIEITPPERGMNCWVGGLNDHGTVVGSIGADREYRTAYSWQAGKRTGLYPLDRGNTYATGITNDDVAYGDSYNRHGIARGVLWRKRNDPYDIGVAGSSVHIAGVSSDGPYTAYAENRGNPISWILYNGNRLEYLPEGCIGHNINGQGGAVGACSLPKNKGTQPFFYFKQKLTKLPTLGGKIACARDINNQEWIVGQSGLLITQQQRGCLWCNNRLYDLNRLIQSSGKLLVTNATSINNNNVIAGAAIINGKEIACLLVPER